MKKKTVFSGWSRVQFPSESHHRGYFLKQLKHFHCARKWPHTELFSKIFMEKQPRFLFWIPVIGTSSYEVCWFSQRSWWCLCFPFLVPFLVPSVYPRNVTVHQNGSWLVIRWKAPPDDKINGIPRGYEIIVRYGAQMTKVSPLSLVYI